MTLSGGWRGRGAHDIDGTSARAREKRETKRTTRQRLEQLEVRGAFCFAVLARARADRVGGGGPACTAGGGLWRIFGKTGFSKILGNSGKVAPGAGSPCLVSKTAPSRARPLKNILAGTDGSGGPPEPSGPARMFFSDRAREGAELVTG